MKIKSFKKLILLLSLTVTFGLIGCNKGSESKEEGTKESGVNLTKVLEYKNSNIGDNSAVINIVNNLPGNIYSDGIELHTDKEPYGVTVNYNKNFKEITIEFEDESRVESSFEAVMKDNAMILFSLIPNVDIVNLKIEDKFNMEYKREEIVEAHKDEYGNNLEKITASKEALENFIKNNKYNK